MLYTNQKIIVHDTNDLDELENAADELRLWLLDNKGINAELELSEDPSKGFPQIVLPKEVTWSDMDNALRPNIGLRAINEDDIKFDFVESVKIKHQLSEEEELICGKELTQILKKEAELALEKKQKMAEFKAALEELEAKKFEQMDQIANGYRYDEVQAIKHVNFIDKRKYYLDVNNPENILKSVPLDPEDYQLRIDHTFDAKVIPLEPGTAEGDDDNETPDLSESDMDDYAQEMVASGTDEAKSGIESDETDTESSESDTENTENVSGPQGFEDGTGELDFETA